MLNVVTTVHAIVTLCIHRDRLDFQLLYATDYTECMTSLRSESLITITHAPETGAINRLHFLAPVFGAGFSYHMRYV